MAHVCRYWRPRSLDDAFLLLERPYAVVIGGGTRLSSLHGDSQPVEVVDLQDVVRPGVRPGSDGPLIISGGTTLQALADDPRLPAVARAAMRRERPSTLRSQATIGAFAARPPGDSLLLATLLAYDARVEVADRAGRTERSLLSLVSGERLSRADIVTSVHLPTAGRAGYAVTARTGADRPIVAAVARSAPGRFRLVVAGVAAFPVVVDEVGDAERAIGMAAQSPAAMDDFRGSRQYREAVARVLAQRAESEVTG